MNGKKKSLVLFETEEQPFCLIIPTHLVGPLWHYLNFILSATVKEKTCINMLTVWNCNGVPGLEIHCFPGYLYG
ncbi:hypothetical protein SLEP1_g27096 [Rubroshorea leprosula]|uniref:Uncharacterized protein n=1 Tax=Rubroshorea leprosula TaxID=152421 RepID=A0AAV5JVR4_9ROSI|nr:hypothetical protein SLEP1_g27096 [Rubroshorea leprosula]